MLFIVCFVLVIVILAIHELVEYRRNAGIAKQQPATLQRPIAKQQPATLEQPVLARVAAALKGPINEREAVALLAELEAEKAALEAEKVTLEADKAALEAEGAAKMARLAAQLDAMTAAHARRAELILVVETWWTILASCTAALYIHMLLRTQYWDPLAQARWNS
ncbi:hypothetical protein PCANC_02271 [Puccinia coronata f. sp. avenae]|uniref:Endoplasmic reticulum transmembrane protein n=1 Tax=Puccinia coronata f. sp. avenae TaxID=200324 RepID=A0A2N5SK56_9BASI|nr:hypothetical protein PCANC_16331 [Puccinia coronata f. sp. avenae]PLW55835.1 hypothetical protein PCANC_02271 [Puccinia coronata f. sp. avenae]